MAVTAAQQKDINKILKKYPDSCSVCKGHFDDDELIYTVFGYDKLQRMQVEGRPRFVRNLSKVILTL